MKAVEKQIAARLLTAGELTEEDLEKALKRHTGRQSFADLLVEKGYATQRAVTRAQAEVNGFQFVDLSRMECAPEAISLLKPEEAMHKHVLPLEYDGHRLTIALADPNDVYTSDHLRLRLGCEVVVRIADKEDLSNALNRYYSADNRETRVSGVAPALEEIGADDDEGENSHREYQRRVREMRSSGMVRKDIGENISNMDTIIEESMEQVSTLDSGKVTSGEKSPPKLLPNPAPENITVIPEDPAAADLERVLRQALEAHAQDIEFTPLERCVGIRIRTATQWIPLGIYPINQHEEVIARLLNMSNVECDLKGLPAERELMLNTPFGEMACHLQTQVTEDGLRLVLRFAENVELLRSPLVRLGLPNEISQSINRRLRARAGGLLFVSSLNARSLDQIYSSILASLAQAGGNDVLSLESFQRRRLPGVTPVHCPTEESLLIDLENAEYMSPDVVGIQTVRTTSVLCRAFDVALNGTAVIACFTAPDAQTAQACLASAGMEPMNMLRGLLGHLHVEVVKKLCVKCARPIEDRSTLPEWANVIEADFKEAAGCEHCKGTGYDGDAYLVDYFQPNPSSTSGELTHVLERQTPLIAMAVAGEVDPREY